MRIGVNFSCDKDLIEEFKTECATLGVVRSKIIQVLIKRWLDEQKTQRRIINQYMTQK